MSIYLYGRPVFVPSCTEFFVCCGSTPSCLKVRVGGGVFESQPQSPWDSVGFQAYWNFVREGKYFGTGIMKGPPCMYRCPKKMRISVQQAPECIRSELHSKVG